MKNSTSLLLAVLIWANLCSGCKQNIDSYETDEKLPSGVLDWKIKVDEWLSSPTVSQDLVFINGVGAVYALDANSGQTKWTFNRGKYLGSSPAISAYTVYIGGMDNLLHAIDTDSGQKKWDFRTDGFIFSTPAISEGSVYFGSYDGYLYSLNAETGQEQWKFKTQGLNQPFNIHDTKAEYEVLGAIGSSPVISNGIIYFGSHDGHLYALDVKTGNEKWRFNVGTFLSNPVVLDRVIYFGSYDGYFYAVDDKGQLNWKITIPDSPSVSSATFINKVAYFVSSLDKYEPINQHQYFLYAIEIETSKLLWKTKLQADAYGLTSAGNVLYFGDDEGFVIAIDSQTGDEKWKFKAESSIVSEIVIQNDRAYFCTRDGYLYALK